MELNLSDSARSGTPPPPRPSQASTNKQQAPPVVEWRVSIKLRVVDPMDSGGEEEEEDEAAAQAALDARARAALRRARRSTLGTEATGEDSEEEGRGESKDGDSGAEGGDEAASSTASRRGSRRSSATRRASRARASTVGSEAKGDDEEDGAGEGEGEGKDKEGKEKEGEGVSKLLSVGYGQGAGSGKRKIVKTAKQRRAEKRARRARRKAAKARKVREEREQKEADLEANAQVWEEKTDSLGNLYWVHTETKATVLEHPVSKARRELTAKQREEERSAADYKNPLAQEHGKAREPPQVAAAKARADAQRLANFGQLNGPLRRNRGIKLNTLVAKSRHSHFNKFLGKGATRKHLQPHAYDVAIKMEKEAQSRDEDGVVVGGVRIKIVRPKKDFWRPQPHNHIAVYVRGREYCVTCRQYKYEHLQSYWKAKEDLVRTRHKQRIAKQRSEEARRKEEFAKLERIWSSGKEAYRRANMEPKRREKHMKKWRKQVYKEYKRRDKVLKRINGEIAAEKTRNAMWGEEQAQRRSENEDIMQEEADQQTLQRDLRQVYLQLMSDCKGLERLKQVSWQRGVARGTHSTFHVVRDSTRNERFVLKTMFCPNDSIERRVLVQANAINNLRCPFLLTIDDAFAHPMYPGLGDRKKGYVVVVVVGVGCQHRRR